MGLSQHEIERLCQQSLDWSRARRDHIGRHGLWWWAGVMLLAVLVWLGLVVIGSAVL